jgi:hypothetical protein
MSSTKKVASSNQEKMKILSISIELSDSEKYREIMGLAPQDGDSYYQDRQDLKLFDSLIFEYDFSSLAELKNMIQRMWQFQECEFMKEYAVVSTIAAFRYKVEECVEKGITAYIYQF